MVFRLFLLYAVIELVVVVALSSTIGFGWTALLLLGTWLVGLMLAGSEVKRHLRRLLSGLDRPQAAVADSVLVALGTVLVTIPGLVSSALGLLLLMPPSRAAVRPLYDAIALRRAPVIAGRYTARRDDYIDGEVIDVVDVEPLPLPRHPE